MATLKIQRVDLDSLKLDPNNAREHGEENLEAIAASLKQFGQVEPLVVQKRSRQVIGGNGRLAIKMPPKRWSPTLPVPFTVSLFPNGVHGR